MSTLNGITFHFDSYMIIKDMVKYSDTLLTVLLVKGQANYNRTYLT